MSRAKRCAAGSMLICDTCTSGQLRGGASLLTLQDIGIVVVPGVCPGVFGSSSANCEPQMAERTSPMSVLSKSLNPAEATDSAERRGTIRHQITVSAEVVELKSGTKFSTRTTDLGPGGCFVDTLMPLPVGSAVRTRLQKDNVTFDAMGTVTFSQTGLGMGIAFDEMPPERLAALDAWLVQLTSSRPAAGDAHGAAGPAAAGASKETRATRKQSDTTHKLIRLLVKRGVISERDAETLIDEPLL